MCLSDDYRTTTLRSDALHNDRDVTHMTHFTLSEQYGQSYHSGRR